MKELEENNVLDNEFLNLLDEQDSTLANDIILGATDDIGEEPGDECEDKTCEKDERACVGDRCPTDGVCATDGCSSSKATTDTCDTDVPTYYSYLVKFASAAKGSEKNEDTPNINLLSYPLIWSPTNIMASNVSATHASNITFVNAVKNNITTLITGNTYSQFTGRTSSAMSIYNPNGQYSATPFCYVKNVRLAYNGHITKTVNVPCYMKTNSSTGTPSVPTTFQAPLTTNYLKANDYIIRVRDGQSKNTYLDGAEVYFNNMSYFNFHSGLTYLLTGKAGIVSVSTSANVSYLTGYVKKLSFSNNQPVYFTAYPNSDTEIVLDNDNTVNQVANKADLLRMYPAITQYLTGITSTARCFTNTQLNASGITLDNTINTNAILNRRAYHNVDPGFDYLFNDATLGIGNPNFDGVSTAITATTTTTQFAVLPSTPQLGIHEFCLYYLATGSTSQTGTVTFTLYGRIGTLSWYELYSGSTTKNSQRNYITIPYWYTKLYPGANARPDNTFIAKLGIKVNSTASTMPRIVIPKQVIMLRTNDSTTAVQGDEQV